MAEAEKEEAAVRFGALAVEMEAVGVAAAAANHKKFAAIKAISDGAEDEMDFLAGFLTPEGFGTARFMAHIRAASRAVGAGGGPEAAQQTGFRGAEKRGGGVQPGLAGICGEALFGKSGSMRGQRGASAKQAG